jgi:hypothetical protein
VSTEDEPPFPLAALRAAYRERRRPRRNVRILQSPTGFVEIRFWSRRRAWISIYDAKGWPARRLTRWATREQASLGRVLRRAGFAEADADRLAEQIAVDWGEPVGDVADVVIPAVTMMALTAVGAVVVGRWLLGRAAFGARLFL